MSIELEAHLAASKVPVEVLLAIFVNALESELETELVDQLGYAHSTSDSLHRHDIREDTLYSARHSTMLACAAVCRAWKDPAYLYAYEHIKISSSQSYESFVWTIKNTSYGVHVKSLRLTRFSTTELGMWLSLLEQGSDGALKTLQNRCPNIRELSLSDDIPIMWTPNDVIPTGLAARLRVLHMGPVFSDRWIAALFAESTPFDLPGIRELWVSGCKMWPIYPERWKSVSTLRAIILTDVEAERETLYSLLTAASSSLQTLKLFRVGILNPKKRPKSTLLTSASHTAAQFETPPLPRLREIATVDADKWHGLITDIIQNTSQTLEDIELQGLILFRGLFPIPELAFPRLRRLAGRAGSYGRYFGEIYLSLIRHACATSSFLVSLHLSGRFEIATSPLAAALEPAAESLQDLELLDMNEVGSEELTLLLKRMIALETLKICVAMLIYGRDPRCLPFNLRALHLWPGPSVAKNNAAIDYLLNENLRESCPSLQKLYWAGTLDQETQVNLKELCRSRGFAFHTYHPIIHP